MPSELRLHPASVILGFGSYVRSLAAPGVGVVFCTAWPVRAAARFPAASATGFGSPVGE